jgi:hypothetical protein
MSAFRIIREAPQRLAWVENGGSDLGNVIAAGRSTELDCRQNDRAPGNDRTYRLGQALQWCVSAGAIGRPHRRSNGFYHATPDNMSFAARLVMVKVIGQCRQEIATMPLVGRSDTSLAGRPGPNTARWMLLGYFDAERNAEFVRKASRRLHDRETVI